MTKQTLNFQAEVAQLLHLVTHSLYSNKEIFLRELISNASDACDKLRFEAINNSGLYETDPDLKVKVTFDKDAKTLTITDNGIGLSQQEAIDNLGTIAKSGTKDFVSKLSGDQKADSQLIGQFGVGFYSGFIVAHKITVESRRAGMKTSEGVRWVSGGAGGLEVETIDRAERGTSVILHLNDDALDYASAWKLKGIIAKYSDHISLPILMEKEEWKDGELINPSDENGGRQPGVIAAETLVNILDHLLAPLVLEIDVDVWRLLARGGNKTLEQKIMLGRIDLGDAQTKTDDAIGRRPAPLRKNAAPFRKAHDVVNGQKICRVIQFAD